MTKISHVIGRNRVEGESDNPGFILGNKLGGYFSLFKNRWTKYEGAFYCESFDVYQVISNIMPANAPEVTEHTNKLHCVERKRHDLKETFFFPHYHNTLVYELSEERDIILDLDVRKAYDMREFGRYYTMTKEGDRLIIRFVKKTDEKEDSTNLVNEFTMYIVITGADSYDMKGKFHPVDYEYDKHRVHHPEIRHVYHAVNAKAKRLFISFSTDKDKAIAENDKVKNEYEKLLDGQKRHYYAINAPKDDLIQMAYTSSYNALNDLVVTIDNKDGIFAGYHWFFQVWTRDEAISLKALIIEKKYDLAKTIIFRQLGKIMEDGRIPSRYPYSDLQSADGVGWVLKRLTDLIEELAAKNILNDHLSREEILIIKNKVETIIFSLLTYHTEDKLAINNQLETWMDTEAGNDFRDGARIEIQALRLSMYKLMKILCKADGDDIGYKMADNLEQEMIEEVKVNFLQDGMLLDGVDDNTMRPNIFLACYIYPELLSKSQWQTAFSKALPALWDGWGGLSSIDKKHKLYHGTYTGQTNESYHRGDSWFFVNCMAAICMNRMGKTKFKKEIAAILDSTTREILFDGVIGTCAEVSSSDQQDSKGCLSQAWSDALYMELVKELF